MRKFLSAARLLAMLSVSTAAAAADFSTPNYAPNPGPTYVDFSGIGLGLDVAAAIGSAGSASTSGGIGGAHVGYNLQSGPIVGGVEADAMLGSIQGGLAGGTFSQDFLTSARVKGGYAFGQILGYGTLGWGWSETDYSRLGHDSTRDLPGIVYGVGAEFAITRAWSVRAELLRYNFSGATYSAPGGSQSATTSTNLLRVGLSTRF